MESFFYHVKAVTLLTLVLMTSACSLDVSILGQGDVIISGDHSQKVCITGNACYEIPFNTKVELTATPKPGYIFSHWSGNCAGSNSCALTISNNKQVNAIFTAKPDTPLSFEFSPGNHFYFASPWPNNQRVNDDGTLDVNNFPFDKNGSWSTQLSKLANNQVGFSTNGFLYFQTANELPSDVELHNAAGVFLLPIDANANNSISTTLSTYKSDNSQKDNLLVIRPNQALKSNTTYSVIITKSIGLQFGFEQTSTSPLLARIRNPKTALTDRESRYRDQWTSLQPLLTSIEVLANDVVAYSVFTTQDTHRYHNMVNHVVSNWDQEFILDRVIESTVIAECDEWGNDMTLSLTVEFPSYLTGTAPYTSGGGKLNVVDNRLVEVGVEELVIGVNIPCDIKPDIQSWGIEVLGAGTAESSYSDHINNRAPKETIRVQVDAPYSQWQREPEIGGFLLALLDKSGIDQNDLFKVLSHFNPFNLASNVGLHYQYTMDMLFAKKVAEQIESIHGPLGRPIDSTKTAYSGYSFGSMAAFHAGAIDPDTDSMTLTAFSRIAHESINHLFNNNESLIPKIVVDLISSYIGVELPIDPNEPTLHLLQTVYETIDLINFVDDVQNTSLWMTVDYFDHPVHGGATVYDLIDSLNKSSPFDMRYDFGETTIDQDARIDLVERIEDTVGRPYEFNSQFVFSFEESTPLRIVTPDFRSWHSDCFTFEVLNKPEFVSDEYERFWDCYH